jgi:uncharacterized membrane protein
VAPRWGCGCSGQMIALGDDMHTTQPKGRQQHPVVVAHRAHRAADLQLRVADGITAFVGSMPFVYIHAALFGIWMLFIESNPWPMLTLIVSLEAIFLSTFVMIGQNRQSAFSRPSRSRLQRTGTRTQGQHGTDSRDLYGHHRAAQPAP